MLFGYATVTILLVSLVHGNVFFQPFQQIRQNQIQKNERKAMAAMDNEPAADEHHKIIILVPQVVEHVHKKKPKSHHHHHKVLPVVHSGKVIHDHIHHGKVDHTHKHHGHGKHEHKHVGNAGHKHSHFGVGTHTHKHQGKGVHEHKHDGKAAHQHAHTGKGTMHHVHSKHHPMMPPAPAEPPKKAPPPHKLLAPFLTYGPGAASAAEDELAATPRIKIDSELLKSLNPAAFGPPSGALTNGMANTGTAAANPGRFIQIRIPDENEANVVKEIDIDTESDVAVLKKNYLSPEEVQNYFSAAAAAAKKGKKGGKGGGAGAGGGGDEDEAEDEAEEDADDEEAYTLGADSYRLAPAAVTSAGGYLQAATTADGESTAALSYSAQDLVRPMLPQFSPPSSIPHSNTYNYQY